MEESRYFQFLEAMSSWVEDMDGYYLNTTQAVPKNINWSVLSDIIQATKVYE
nr:hypothetical protein [Xylocopilactobacillus apis]